MTGNSLTIVHCLRAPVGGAFRHVRDLMGAQVGLGHRVGLLCDTGDYGPLNENHLADLNAALPLGVRRVRIPRDIGPGDAFAVRRALAALADADPDVLHGHTAKGGLIARATAAVRSLNGGRKVHAVYTPHGGSLHFSKRSLKGMAIFGVERALERATSGLVFVSRYEADTYIEKVGAPTVPWRVIHNGVLPDEFETVPVVEKPADFLFIGEMRHLKGPDLFLEAIASLRRNGAPVTALMVGDGPDRAAVEALREKLGLVSAVAMEAPQPIRQALAKARTVVMPSRAESLPYVVIETVAAGHPIIASRVGGIPEIFGESAYGLVEPGDVDALVVAMASVLDDPRAANERALNLQASARRRFSVGLMAARITDFYSELAGPPRSVSREDCPGSPRLTGQQPSTRSIPQDGGRPDGWRDFDKSPDALGASASVSQPSPASH